LHPTRRERSERDREEAGMKIDKILVPLDGSALAEMAIPKALDITRDSGASVLFLRAAEAPRLTTDQVEAQVDVVREAEKYLESIAARVKAEGFDRFTTSVWYGPAAPVIVEAAQITKADLIVMSTHGRSGLGRLLVGSVAESVLRGTHTPILLLRPDGAPVEKPQGRADAKAAREIAHV
jgi:nucleotide-binding universal stress UspA family protein